MLIVVFLNENNESAFRKKDLLSDLLFRIFPKYRKCRHLMQNCGAVFVKLKGKNLFFQERLDNFA